MWCHIEDKCAILYDGINQQGASENIPIGEFEHSRNGFLFKAIFCTMQHGTCLYMLGLNPLWATIISTVKQLCYSAIDQNQLTSIQLGLIRKILVLMGASIDSFGIKAFSLRCLLSKSPKKDALWLFTCIILYIQVLFINFITMMDQKLSPKITISHWLVYKTLFRVGDAHAQHFFLTYQNCNKITWNQQSATWNSKWCRLCSALSSAPTL